MSEYLHVEKLFLDHLATLGWTVIDQGQGIPQDPAASLRTTFREYLLPDIFRDAVRALNRLDDAAAWEDRTPWLSDRQLAALRDQIVRQPNRTRPSTSA